ncbi:hypothetical protein B0H16DRAFT_1481271 [Mycena metata]|uniref:Uncharacterized protein n=1 Tax=Mycena metata TaxID=1033252 RepID=A0AAD7GZR5_9AGAR|nr:hypothetical protein B0H16DRAFT_1481271 [Mycena metata]
MAASGGRHALHTVTTPGRQVSPNWRCTTNEASGGSYARNSVHPIRSGRLTYGSLTGCAGRGPAASPRPAPHPRETGYGAARQSPRDTRGDHYLCRWEREDVTQLDGIPTPVAGPGLAGQLHNFWF